MSENFSAQFAGWLQGTLSRGRGSKNALSLADNPSAGARAMPLLGPWLNKAGNAQRQEAVRFAAAAIARSGIRHKAGATLGSCVAGAELAQDSLERRAMAIHSQPLRRAHPQIARLLTAAAKAGRSVDFRKVVDAYLYWDREPLAAQSARNRFILDFYSPRKPSPEPTSPDADE